MNTTFGVEKEKTSSIQSNFFVFEYEIQKYITKFLNNLHN